MAMTDSPLPVLRLPRAVLFDVYDTLFLNSPDDWIVAFDGICAEQRLPLSGHDLWTSWKRHEVRFRQVRTNLAERLVLAVLHPFQHLSLSRASERETTREHKE